MSDLMLPGGGLLWRTILGVGTLGAGAIRATGNAIQAGRELANHPRTETPEPFESSGVIYPALPAELRLAGAVASPASAGGGAPRRSETAQIIDWAALKREQEILLRQHLDSQHARNQGVLNAALATAQKPEMAVRLNGRRVDEAIPVTLTRGADPLSPGQSIEEGLSAALAQHRRFAFDANANSDQYKKVVTLRRFPGEPTPVLTAYTATRSELETLLRGGYITEQDLASVGVSLDAGNTLIQRGVTQNTLRDELPGRLPGTEVPPPRSTTLVNTGESVQPRANQPGTDSVRNNDLIPTLSLPHDKAGAVQPTSVFGIFGWGKQDEVDDDDVQEQIEQDREDAQRWRSAEEMNAQDGALMEDGAFSAEENDSWSEEKGNTGAWWRR